MVGVVAYAQAPGLAPVAEYRISMTARPDSHVYQTGGATSILKYVVTPDLGGQGLNPILHVRHGMKFVCDFKNELSEPTTIHWHGLDVPASVDGHPADAIPPGGRFRYQFPILNRAGTYWFHPHPDSRTAFQVAQGLAGVMIVNDEEEDALPLPRGRRDQVLVVQDRILNTSNQITYAPGVVPGYLGNRIFVNGQPNATRNVDTAVYRLRVLNGCNARILKIAFSNGLPLVAIGTDQGLLAAPVTKPYIMLAPGERVELWADFRTLTVGSTFKLVSQTFSPGGPTGGGSGLNQGAAFDILTFNVTQAVTDNRVLPSVLSSSVPNYTLAQATNAANPRIIQNVSAGAQFWLNGSAFAMNTVASNEVAKLGDVELWEIRNNTTGTVMSHPIHLHSSGFKIIQRIQSGGSASQVNTMKDGMLDEGFKDTFLLMPGETVRILHKPLFYTGRFLYHCHNLEHEDNGMMRNFRVDP